MLPVWVYSDAAEGDPLLPKQKGPQENPKKYGGALFVGIFAVVVVVFVVLGVRGNAGERVSPLSSTVAGYGDDNYEYDLKSSTTTNNNAASGWIFKSSFPLRGGHGFKKTFEDKWDDKETQEKEGWVVSLQHDDTVQFDDDFS